MIALSLFSSFFISFLFFITTCFVIVLDLIIHQNLPVFFLKNFNTIILQCISLISIIPFTYLVANKYHMKDFLFALLRSKVATDEAIMEKLPELIIITDSRFHILSVNDAVEKTLLKSRSEMLHMPVFDVLKLQDGSGKIVTKETFLSNGEVQPKQTQNTYTLLLSSLSKRTVTVQIQVTKNAEFNTNQIS